MQIAAHVSFGDFDGFFVFLGYFESHYIELYKTFISNDVDLLFVSSSKLKLNRGRRWNNFLLLAVVRSRHTLHGHRHAWRWTPDALAPCLALDPMLAPIKGALVSTPPL